MTNYAATITFRAKRVYNRVKLVTVKDTHVQAERIVPLRAVQAAWSDLFGSSGRVDLNDPLVTHVSDPEAYMPTVTVTIPNVRDVVRIKRDWFPQRVKELRASGMSWLAAEEHAHEELRATLLES